MNNIKKAKQALKTWQEHGVKPELPGWVFYTNDDWDGGACAHHGDNLDTVEPIVVDVVRISAQGSFFVSNFVRYPADCCQYCGHTIESDNWECPRCGAV